MTNRDVANALEEIGVLLQLQGESDFRTKAYANTARTLEQLGQDVTRLVAERQLDTIRGIGTAMAEKITTLVTTGRLPFLEELRAAVPAGLREMLQIQGLGPKKVKAIHDELGITTIEALRKACQDGSVAALKGFGAKSTQKILEGIEFLGVAGQRVRLIQVEPFAEALLQQVRQWPGVDRAEFAGSLRRRRETLKDLDLVVGVGDLSSAPGIMAAFVGLPSVVQVQGQGETKSSILAKLGETTRGPLYLSVDLRVVPLAQFPVTWLHFMGSKEHNIRLRQRALERGLTLNEYALSSEDGPIPVSSEAEVYDELDLPFFPPECREDRGEFELAARAPWPRLIEVSDLRGVFHNHTTASDGTASLEVMAEAARALGFQYFGLGDHSQSLQVANGLSPERVRQQWKDVEQLNAQYAKQSEFRILKGTECDILPDGRLDYDDDLLAGFDYVVAAIHTHFGLSEVEQTARICKALAHPWVTMLAHPTGRLLLRREGYRVNLEAVLLTAKEHGKIIEINAQPDRLDLDWAMVRRAKELGVRIAINTDAHDTTALSYIRYGVDVARRGLLSAADVVNTQDLPTVLAEFAQIRKRARV